MAWTAPRTWTTGEVVTSTIMNTHVRDNFLAVPYVVAQSGAGATVTNTTTETDLISFTVPAGALGANGLVRVTGHAVYQDVPGSTNCSLRWKFGSTTVHGLLTAQGTSANFRSLKLDFIMGNLNNTAAQSGRATYAISDANPSDYGGPNLYGRVVSAFAEGGFGGPTEDTTSAKTLKMTVQWGAASTDRRIQLLHYTAEILRIG